MEPLLWPGPGSTEMNVLGLAGQVRDLEAAEEVGPCSGRPTALDDQKPNRDKVGLGEGNAPIA